MQRLRLEVIKDEPSSFQMQGLVFHETVRNRSKVIPCLTTPAPTADGRPPPKRMKGKISAEARQRWLSGNRQYAPWAYEAPGLVFEKSGEGQLLPAEVKEQLHHYPVGLTRCESVTHKDRHRLLGNSWHLGVARFLLALVLLQGMCTPAASAAATLDDYMADARVRAIPVAGHVSSSARAAVQPSQDMWEQWEHSLQMRHPLLVPPRMENALERTMQALKDMGSSVVQRREDILSSIRVLRDQMRAETEEWYARLPQHVARAYTLADGCVVQIPLLMRLLRGCGYPDCDNLETDLCRGFPLLGELRRSPGWHPRTDDWYAHPISESTFHALNSQHIRDRLQRHRPDPEWQAMLHEVLAEKAQGRIDGPFQAHHDWGFMSVSEEPGGHAAPLKPLPPGPAYAAFAFSVVQEGSDGNKKVRRCEGYRRSHHNSTIRAVDKPPHDTVETYVRILIAWALSGEQAQIWCQDLMAAYRQYPVLAWPTLICCCRSHMGCPSGSTLSCHSEQQPQSGTLIDARMQSCGWLVVCC